MSVIFESESHSYTSQNKSDNISWLSVTTLLNHLKEPFDSDAISLRSSKKKDSKWFGMTKDQIQKVWKDEAERATTVGNWYHDMCESDLLSCNTIERYGKQLPIIQPIIDSDGRKIASSQRLIEGIYPEHLVYLRSAGICGQSDRIEVVNGYVNVIDYKTNKKIEKNSYVNWEGFSKKMYSPVSHLEDCNYVHYNLQLSIYMYMILKHNPHLKPGKIIIQHVSFHKEDEPNQYGYPIMKTLDNGDYIVEDIVNYEMPYLKDEVQNIVKWYKTEGSLLAKRKK